MSRLTFPDIRWAISRQLICPNRLGLLEIQKLVLEHPLVQDAIRKATTLPKSSTSVQNVEAKGSAEDEELSNGVAGRGSGTNGGGITGPAGSTASSLEGRRAVTLKQARTLCKQHLNSMTSMVRPNGVKVLIYFFRKLWRAMYEGIRVNQEGVRMLRALTEAGKPYVLLPMHKSHMDYLLVSYMCASHNLYPPHIIAGENLNMAVVGQILRLGGAIFIKRRFHHLPLYTAVFNAYIAVLISHGHNIECFVEGTRSRSGKLRFPKTGFLKALCGLYAASYIPEVHLVPCAISYDKLWEGAAFVNEMLGEKKRQESLAGLINATNHIVRLNFGSIDAHICDPIPLSAIYKQGGLTKGAYLRCSRADRNRFVLGMAHQVLYEMNVAATTTASAMFATILLGSPQRGVTIREMTRQMDWLKDEILKRGSRLSSVFYAESTEAIVERCARVLRKMFKRNKNILYRFENRESLELAVYRNQLIHLFVSESLMAVALAAEMRERFSSGKHPPIVHLHHVSGGNKHAPAPLSVSRERLLDSVRFISQLLKYEFVYKPTPDIAENFDATIEAMIQRGILRDVNGGIAIDPNGKDMFLFLCMLAWPFVDVYWISVASLYLLQTRPYVEDSVLARKASGHAETLFYQGGLHFFEALNTDSIRNAYAWCQAQGIVTSTRITSKSPPSMRALGKVGVKLLALHPRLKVRNKLAALPSSRVITSNPNVVERKLFVPLALIQPSNAVEDESSPVSPPATAREPALTKSKEDSEIDHRRADVRKLRSLAEILDRIGEFRMRKQQQRQVLSDYVSQLSSEEQSSKTILSFLRSKF